MQRQHITVSVQDIVDTLEISKKLVLSFKSPCNLNALIVKQPTLNFLGRYIYPSDSEVIKINMGTKCFYEFISALMIKTWKKFEVNIFFWEFKGNFRGNPLYVYSSKFRNVPRVRKSHMMREVKTCRPLVCEFIFSYSGNII